MAIEWRPNWSTILENYNPQTKKMIFLHFFCGWRVVRLWRRWRGWEHTKVRLCGATDYVKRKKKPLKNANRRAAKQSAFFLVPKFKHPPKHWQCSRKKTAEKCQPKGGKLLNFFLCENCPNGTFFFVGATAVGKAERTWSAGCANKEKTWRETLLVPE